MQGSLGDFDRFRNVDRGQDDFLAEEADHLDLFHHVVAGDEGVCVSVAVRSEGQDGGGDVERNGVENDHVFGPSEDAFASFAADE